MADQEYEFIGRILAVMRTCATFPAGKPFGCSDVAERTGRLLQVASSSDLGELHLDNSIR